MITNKPASIFLNLYLQIILPLNLINEVFLRNYDTIIEYILLGINVLVIFYFLFSFCYWEYTNFYLRYIYVFFITVGILPIIYKIIFANNMVFGKLSDLGDSFSTIIWTIIFLTIDIRIIISKIRKDKSFNLELPFKNGQFLVIDGGDGKASYFTNYHYYAWKRSITNFDTMRFAIDLIKLNKYGFVKRTVLPSNNSDFNIYEEKVYSPLEGEVVKVVSDKDDNCPYSKLPKHYGNRITIKSGNYYTSLYHFKKDTIVVNVGQKLSSGDYIGKVGNSGHSIKPHLHIQVVYSEEEEYWLGKGIPILFNDKYPVKNCLINADSTI